MATRKKSSEKTGKTGKQIGKKTLGKKAPGKGSTPARVQRKKAGKRGRKSAAPALAGLQAARRRRPQRQAARGTASEVFEGLAAILVPYAPLFEAEMQPRMGYCLKAYGEWPSEVYFAGVEWTESGVYFHLFPLLRHPFLLEGIGPGLRGHLEGKLSFRFEALSPELAEELAAVTEAAFQCLRGEGLFPQAG